MPDDLNERLVRIENKLDSLIERISRLEGEQRTVSQLLRWVVFPLLIMVGALVGVKLVFPS